MAEQNAFKYAFDGLLASLAGQIKEMDRKIEHLNNLITKAQASRPVVKKQKMDDGSSKPTAFAKASLPSASSSSSSSSSFSSSSSASSSSLPFPPFSPEMPTLQPEKKIGKKRILDDCDSSSDSSSSDSDYEPSDGEHKTARQYDFQAQRSDALKLVEWDGWAARTHKGLLCTVLNAERDFLICVRPIRCGMDNSRYVNPNPVSIYKRSKERFAGNMSSLKRIWFVDFIISTDVNENKAAIAKMFTIATTFGDTLNPNEKVVVYELNTKPAIVFKKRESGYISAIQEAFWPSNMIV